MTPRVALPAPDAYRIVVLPVVAVLRRTEECSIQWGFPVVQRLAEARRQGRSPGPTGNSVGWKK